MPTAVYEGGEISEAALSRGLVRSRPGKPGVLQRVCSQLSGRLREWIVVGAVFCMLALALWLAKSLLAGRPMRRGGRRDLGAEGLLSEGAPGDLPFHCLPRAWLGSPSTP